MRGVRAPTDPSHWHAATRVLPRPASSGSVDPRGTCIERGSRRVPARRQPLLSRRGATTSSPHSPPVRSIQHLPKLAGRLRRHRWQSIRQTPIAAPRLASSRILRARRRHVSTNQDGAPSAQPKMVHLRHNHDGAPSAQPSCCTSRVNRESARTGNIARPFVVSVDDVSPNSASEATGRLWAQQVLRSPRDWTRQSETEQDKGQCRPGEASGREYGPYRVCRQPKALLRRADFTDHVSLLSAEVWALSLFAPCLRRAPREKLEPGGWACAPRRLQAGSLAGLAGPAATGRI